MEHAIISLVSIAIILGGTVTLTLSALSPIDTLTNSWKEITRNSAEMMRTDIAGAGSEVLEPYSGNRVEINIRNEGKVALCDYDSWDVIVTYHTDNATSEIAWLPYSATLENNRWTVDGIYYEGEEELFQPGTLNPGETMKLLLQLDPPVDQDSTNAATVSTPNGVSTQVIFQRGSGS